LTHSPSPVFCRMPAVPPRRGRERRIYRPAPESPNRPHGNPDRTHLFGSRTSESEVRSHRAGHAPAGNDIRCELGAPRLQLARGAFGQVVHSRSWWQQKFDGDLSNLPDFLGLCADFQAGFRGRRAGRPECRARDVPPGTGGTRHKRSGRKGDNKNVGRSISLCGSIPAGSARR